MNSIQFLGAVPQFAVAFIGTVAGSTVPVNVNADVTTAISAWWANQSSLQAQVTNGKLWHKTAPEDACVEPYLTFFLVSTTSISQTTSYSYYESVVQFNIHHYLPGLAQTISQNLAAAMDSRRAGGGAILFIQGNQAIHVLPDDFGLDEGEGLGLNGRDCWIAHFTVTIPWTF